MADAKAVAQLRVFDIPADGDGIERKCFAEALCGASGLPSGVYRLVLHPVDAAGVALPATGWKADKLGSSLAWPADTSMDAAGVALPLPPSSIADIQFKLTDAMNALRHAADGADQDVAKVYRARARELAEIVSALAHGVDLPDGSK